MSRAEWIVLFLVGGYLVLRLPTLIEIARTAGG